MDAVESDERSSSVGRTQMEVPVGPYKAQSSVEVVSTPVMVTVWPDW